MKKNLFFFAITACVLFTLNITAETIVTNEFWICNNPDTANLGTLDNPFDGSTRAKFDAIMNLMPPNATIHILAGTYETWGSYDWQMQSGQKILGSGRDNTVLQLPPGTPQYLAGTSVIYTALPLTNAEVADLTVDCNWHGGGYTYGGISIDGTGNIVRRVRVIHCGDTLHTNSESFGIGLGNATLPVSQGNIIEDCEISEFSGGPGISAITMNGSPNGYMSGIIRNNVILLPGNPGVSAFGINGGWLSDVLVEGNYVSGALNAVYSDTGGWTNTLIVNNTFRNCLHGVSIDPANNPLKNLKIAFNKIDLEVTNENCVAFDFWGGDWTNVFIFGNTVDFYNAGPSQGFLIAAQNVTGLVFENNFVDSILASNQLTTIFFTNVANVTMDNNYDLFGNYLSGLNTPMLGGVPVSPSGLSLISSGAASSPFANSGPPDNPGTVLTNNETGVTLSGTFSGNGAGLTGLNWSDITGAPAFAGYSDPAPTFANGMNISANTAYQIGGDDVLWSSAGGSDLVVGYQSPGVMPNGIGNLLVGSYAMPNSTNANGNTMVGISAGRNLLSSTDNTMVGGNAAYVLKYGDDNTFVGFQSGYGNGGFTNGYENTLIGDSSLYRARTGDNNVALGYMAGSWLYAGSNNVFIAHKGTSSETNSNGAIYIGDPGVHNSTYIAGTVHAGTSFAGNGSGLTNLRATSITGTVASANLPFYVRSGATTFPALGSSVAVMFSKPVPDTNYIVTFGFESAAGVTTNIWYNSKTTNGFVVHGTFSPNNVTFDYIAMERQ
jgi:hypothetical protein